MRRMTRWARRSLPPAIVTGARGVVHQWGTLTRGFRMSPSFIVVGGQRCGTTTLYRLLSEHPQVIRPTQVKGTGYFDENYSKGPDWYRGHFPIQRDTKVTFEVSGFYSMHPLAPSRIAKDLPQVRLVMMIRDPVQRAYSAWKHESARGFEDQPFPVALDLEAKRLEGEVERILADPSYRSFALRHHAYVGRGRYTDHILRFHEAVGPDRLYVMDADRFFENPVEEYARLCEWLGLEPHRPARVDRWNAREGAPLDPEIEERLRAEFAEADERLVELLGWKPSWVG